MPIKIISETKKTNPHCMPKNVDIENALEIISIIGTEKVKKVYSLVSWQPVSFAALAKIIKFDEVEKALDNSYSLNQIAKNMHVSKKTIYRLFKKKLENNRKPGVKKSLKNENDTVM
jgi:AraC-like DNA-binding protein